MAKKVVAGYMHAEEVRKILEASMLSGQNITETVSFFIRWGLNHFQYSDKKEFLTALYDEFAKAEINEKMSTPESKAEIERLGREKIKELENVRSGESS